MNNGTDIGSSDELYNLTKLNPAISNIMYIVLCIYTLILVGRIYFTNNKKKTLNLYFVEPKVTTIIMAVLTIFAGLSGLSGCLSIIYHLETPGHELDPYVIHDSDYKSALDADTISALIYGFYALLVIFLYVCWSLIYLKNSDRINLFKDINFWVALLFIIFSGISYTTAKVLWINSFKHCNISNDTDRNYLKDKPLIEDCFTDWQDGYNTYHSFWHIFSGFAGFFWVIIVKTTMLDNLLKSRK